VPLTNPVFTGQVDEAAFYTTTRSLAQVQARFLANTRP
jgi:hypothetical protein